MDFERWHEFGSEDIKTLFDSNMVESVMLDDASNIVMICGGYSNVRTEFVYTPSMPAYSALLQLAGPLEVNQPKSTQRILSLEEATPPELLEIEIFRWGHFNRVVVLDDETVELWCPVSDPEKPRERYCYRGLSYKKMLEKHLGSLAAGDAVDFVTPVPTEQLEEGFKSGMFKKVKMNDDGSLRIWHANSKGEGSEDSFKCPPGTPHIQMLEKYFGPMKPGDVFEIPEEELRNYQG